MLETKHDDSIITVGAYVRLKCVIAAIIGGIQSTDSHPITTKLIHTSNNSPGAGIGWAMVSPSVIIAIFEVVSNGKITLPEYHGRDCQQDSNCEYSSHSH
jgi:hypothetical protein